MPYMLINFNRIIIGIIKSYIKLLNLRIEQRYKRYLFNLVLGGVDNITLRIPQLRKANLLIGQGLQDILFRDSIINKVLSILEYESLLIVVETRKEIEDDFQKGNIMVLWS